LGLSHLDYYFDPDTWFSANLRVIEEFPDVIMFPSWWAEFGMAIEPSAVGSRINFCADQPPNQIPMLKRLEDVDGLSVVNVEADGLMAAALHRYRRMKGRIREAGYTIPVVAARGPLCTAGFLRGLTEFMTDLVESPSDIHKLLDYTTELAIAWLKAQAEEIGDSVEGVLVLDDLPGFLSRRHYLEFAHPYLARICRSFPPEWVKVYHNDANVSPFLEDLAGAGFDVLNWGRNLDVGEVRSRIGKSICLMGNVDPLGLGVRGTPEQVKQAALAVLTKTEGDHVILSVGGGVSPGMPRENVLALVDAVREFGHVPH
jgi:uroporphyrinogen decarboxylase